MKKIILLVLVLLLPFINLSAKENTKKENVEENIGQVQEEILFVKINDIATSSVKIANTIKKTKEDLNENESSLKMFKSIKPYHADISKMLKNKNYSNIENQNPRQLQKMQNEILIHVKQLEKWQKTLKDKVQLYTKHMDLLKSHIDLWAETKKNAIKNDAPKEILKNITSVLLDIKKTSKSVKKRYDDILIISQNVTINISEIQDIQNKLKKNEILFKNKVFYQDKEPLFTMIFNGNFSFFEYIINITNVMLDKAKEIVAYFVANTSVMPSFIIVLVFSAGFILYFNKLYRKKVLFIKESSYSKKEFYFILKPISTILMISMILIVAMFDSRPSSLIELQLYIIILPTIFIILTIIDKKFKQYVYYFFIMYLLFNLNINATDSEAEYRLVMLFINIGLLIYIVSIIKNHLCKIIKINIIQKIAFYFIVLSLGASLISLISNIYGSTLLSSVLLKMVLFVFFASIIFYTLYILLRGYVVISLRRRISSASYMLEKYSNSMESTAKILLTVWVTLWWLLVVFKTVGIYPYIIEIREFVLKTSWEVGQTTVSVQSIFDFFTIIFFTWLVAKLIKIILEVEVFSRFKFPRGAPTAILTTFNYVVIIIGTILALSSLGITTQQFALVIGALGVGIGFGLRNIIANFVSGIILVFERPVQIGDTVEINNTFGDVQSIGARSSTIRTYDGSEVVIPNADFMSKDIINWTYSENDRRKDIIFRVDIDNDVDRILDIMKSVTLSHKDIICQEEELMPTLNSIGEYYLEFKLYFWLKGDVVRAKSKINVSIYKALVDAGIKMPVQKFNRSE